MAQLQNRGVMAEGQYLVDNFMYSMKLTKKFHNQHYGREKFKY